MAYKIQFTKEQKEYVFSITKNKSKQTKMFSVWSYLIMDEGKSIGETYRHHRNNCLKKRRVDMIMTERYFYKLAKLINSYNQIGQEIGQEIGHCGKVSQTIENTKVEVGTEVHKNKDCKFINNNTLYTDYVSVNELCVFAELLMDELKIKSTYVRTLVIKNLSDKLNINRAGMNAYISKAIGNVIGLLEHNRKLFLKAKFDKKKELQVNENTNNAKNLRFNNFDGRNYSDDDLQVIEYGLREQIYNGASCY